MIEDKTKEQQPASPVKPKRGQRLRSLWAQLQCMGLLHRHRLRRKTQNHVNDFGRKLAQNSAVPVIGETLYALGYSTEYGFVRIGRGLRSGWLWLWQAFTTLLANAAAMAFPGAAQMFRDLFGPIWLFFRGCGSLLVHAQQVRKEKGFAAACKASVHYLASGVRRNLKTLPRMAMYVLPVCALAVMVTVFNHTVRQPYALEVQVNGQTVGYVANEDVFNSAREAVQERINYADTDHAKWTVEPTYTVTVAHKTMDENEMADAILKSASDEISEGTALYLDGELTAVCSDGVSLQSYLSSLLEPYEDPENSNVTVGFNKEVTLENGIYFNDSFQDEADVEKYFFNDPATTEIYTARFSFCTNEPSSLFLLLLRCFWTNTTKTISISTATAITEHTITSVTIHHPSPSLPPIDHSPRISYSQMHFVSSLYPLGACGFFPSATQHRSKHIPSMIVILLTCPISVFAVLNGSNSPQPCFLCTNNAHISYMTSAYLPMNSLSQKSTNCLAAVTFQILNQIDSHVRVHVCLFSERLQSERT